MVSLVPLKDTTKSRVKNMLKWFSLSSVNISGTVTDGALAMAGKREGLVKLIEDEAIAAQHSRLVKLSLRSIIKKILHNTKALKMDAMQIMKTVNFIRTKGLNFQKFLKNIDVDYGDTFTFWK